jgi:hypothetical protein
MPHRSGHLIVTHTLVRSYLALPLRGKRELRLYKKEGESLGLGTVTVSTTILPPELEWRTCLPFIEVGH